MLYCNQVYPIISAVGPEAKSSSHNFFLISIWFDKFFKQHSGNCCPQRQRPNALIIAILHNDIFKYINVLVYRWDRWCLFSNFGTVNRFAWVPPPATCSVNSLPFTSKFTRCISISWSYLQLHAPFLARSARSLALSAALLLVLALAGDVYLPQDKCISHRILLT